MQLKNSPVYVLEMLKNLAESSFSPLKFEDDKFHLMYDQIRIYLISTIEVELLYKNHIVMSISGDQNFYDSGKLHLNGVEGVTCEDITSQYKKYTQIVIYWKWQKLWFFPWRATRIIVSEFWDGETFLSSKSYQADKIKFGILNIPANGKIFLEIT